jgi:hypothetical protein
MDYLSLQGLYGLTASRNEAIDAACLCANMISVLERGEEQYRDT